MVVTQSTLAVKDDNTHFSSAVVLAIPNSCFVIWFPINTWLVKGQTTDDTSIHHDVKKWWRRKIFALARYRQISFGLRVQKHTTVGVTPSSRCHMEVFGFLINMRSWTAGFRNGDVTKTMRVIGNLLHRPLTSVGFVFFFFIIHIQRTPQHNCIQLPQGNKVS